MNYPQSITEIFRGVVTRAQGYVLTQLQQANTEIQGIHYTYCPIKEMEDKLRIMSEGVTTPGLRFPLVWVNETPPIPINRANQNGFYGTANLQVWIMFHTEQDYYSEQREEFVFAPILRPIYENIMRAISNTQEFNKPPERNISHTLLEHKFLGTNDKTANVFSEFVDAIEIRNLELPIKFQNCYTPSISN